MKIEDLTVAILAGGDSTRFGSYKAMANFRGKPLLQHMVEIGKKISQDVMVVVSNEEQKDFARELNPTLRVVIDPEDGPKSALYGAVTAFEHAEHNYTLLLPVDSPKAKTDLLITLAQMKDGHGAVVPSWPNGYVEPLHAVYMSEHAYVNGLKALENNTMKMQNLLSLLRNVIYVSTEVLKRFDPKLETFDNVNSRSDLKSLR